MSDLLKEVFGNSEKILNRALDNKNINITIKILLGLYAALAAPKLPSTVANLVDNTFVRIGFAFVIVYMATRDPSIAILVAVAFIVTLQTANKMRLYNTDLSVSQPGETSWLPSAKNNYIQSEEDSNEEDSNKEDKSNNLVENVIDTGKELVENVIDTGSHLTGNVFETGSNLLDNVVETGKELVEDVMETGSNLVQGVGQAGNNLFTNVADIGTNLLGNTIDDNSTANISNPSEQLNEVVEGWDGVYPSSVKNALEISDQNNFVPGADQYSCTRTFNNQHCIQGLEVNAPNGSEHPNFSKF